MRWLFGVCLAALAASTARAQPVTGSALNRVPVCGVDFMGPCLPPAEEQQAEVTPPAPKPKNSAFARIAYDEFAFAGDDPLIKSYIAAETGSGGAGVVTAFAAPPPAAPAGDAMGASADQSLADERGDGSFTPSPDSRYAGSRMDPVHVLPRPAPAGQTLVAVVSPRSATGQLNNIAIKSVSAPPHALEEEAHNYNSGLWDRAPVRPLTVGPKN